MIRFKQIIQMGSDIAALSEDGEIYYGHWVQTGHPQVDIPKFVWRQLPPVTNDVCQYEKKPELTKEERVELRKRIDEALRKGADV